MNGQQYYYDYNAYLGSLALSTREQTFTDKILSKRVIQKLEGYMKKEELTREDLLEILYLLTSEEIKLLAFSEWDRYLLGKFFAWIRDFVLISEKIFILAETEKEENLKRYWIKAKKEMESVVKFLIDVFNYIARSSLSKEAYAFDTLTTQKYEYIYPQQTQQQQAPMPYLWIFRK